MIYTSLALYYAKSEPKLFISSWMKIKLKFHLVVNLGWLCFLGT